MVHGEHKLIILYASQTGNAEDAAERIGREAERRGCASDVQSIDKFEVSYLPYKDTVIFVVSTTGQGDIPDSMKAFWKFILQKNLSEHWLEGVRYAVFGLGDSGYQKYNFAAKKLDTRIAGLGAKSLIERGLGDDQNPSGYEGSLDPWMFSLWRTLIELNPEMFPKGIHIEVSKVKLMDQPKVQITYYDAEQAYSQFPSFTETKCIELQIERACSMSIGKFSCDKSKPDCLLRMIKNQILTTPDCGKDVRHFEFEAHSCEIQYEAGDVLEILPRQKRSIVDTFIKRCSLDPDIYIIVQPKGSERLIHKSHVTNIPIKLRKFVELTMDVASASPRRYFFEVMSAFATSELEKERLQYFASSEGRDDLYQYNQKERRSVLEVLEDFPSVEMPFEWLVQLVPPLKTRAFSISSSPTAHPNQVHLTVNIVKWTTPYKRNRTGLCSTWLAALDPRHSLAEKIPVWFHKGSLPRPQSSTPLILVGPGTGCAPFRGFIEDRAHAHGPIGPILFFFGCRNRASDFLYREFWTAHSRDGGVLSEENGGGFYAAFSRDEAQKIYVQDRMREQKKRVWDLLVEGASVYVAGSSCKMPSDVLSAFEDIVSEEGGVSKEYAATWLKALEKGGRYHVEAWS